MQELSGFDIAVIAITLILGLKGLFKGFIKEAFGLIGIVGGVFVASRLAKDTGGYIDSFFKIDNESTVLLVGFIVSLAAFWAFAYLAGMALSKITSLSGLGIFDRLFGFLFGAGKIFLIFSIIIYALSQVDTVKKKLDKKIGDTIMYPILKNIGTYIVKLDTAAITKKVEKKVNGALRSAKETASEIGSEEIKKGAADFKDAAVKKLEGISSDN